MPQPQGRSAASAETIVAIATAPGRAGIGVVRVSGPRAAALAHAVTGKTLQPRRATYADFLDADGGLIDQGIAVLYRAPHSYTGEDVLELQGHGGDAVLQLLLRRCERLGCRLAEPGEFTKRAFLNDKLDLAQAEAVADLIDAATGAAARSAVRSLSGEFSAKVRQMREVILDLRMFVEAALDFPEEDIDFIETHGVSEKLAQLDDSLKLALASGKMGVLLRSGIRVVILGQPNVGKSSLLNRLAGEDLAIVTAVPGTTRDPVRERIHLHGVPIHIIDTAGLRAGGDEVERIGIERTWQAAAQADLGLLVMDARSGFGAAEEAIQARLPVGVPVIHVLNKIDLLPAAARGKLKSDDTTERVSLSVISGEGMEALQQVVLRAAGWQGSAEHALMARARHVAALTAAQEHVAKAADRLAQPELLAEELRLAQHELTAITGEFSADDLLGEIFGRFCIGK